jgi:hypothetical protein
VSFRFLIDECLTPELVEMAVQAGHVESTCIRDRGLVGKQDWDLMPIIVSGDFTFVTLNAGDFRGKREEEPGGLFASQEIHAGLVCLQSSLPMSLTRQRALFQYALDWLRTCADLVNQVLEVDEDENGIVTLRVYDIPKA